MYPKKQFSEDVLILVIFATFEKHFLIIIHKKLDDRVNLENDGIFPSKLPTRGHNNWFMNLIFFVNCNQKTFSKNWKKSLKLMHLHENWYYTLVISKVHYITYEAFFVKWTTTGEPPVC